MDIKNFKAHLLENIEYVEEVLIKHFHNVKYHDGSKQWRFGFTEECNPNSIRLSATDLSYKDYKNSEEGDFFSLIMRKLRINLGKCLTMLTHSSAYVDESLNVKEVFGGFFKNIGRTINQELVYIDEKEILKYPETISKFFLKEGITVEAQSKFNIRIDIDNDRIVIPVYMKGRLVGAIGRYNLKDSGNIPKYLPTIPYHKKRVLFGYDVNYSYAYNNRIYIVESEKTVIKAYGLGYRNLFAIGGNSISETQRALIYSLNPKEIVLVLDKGLGRDRAVELRIDENKYMQEIILRECNSLTSKNVFFKTSVGYINCNEINDVLEKENIFECENIEKYINNIVWME